MMIPEIAELVDKIDSVLVARCRKRIPDIVLLVAAGNGRFTSEHGTASFTPPVPVKEGTVVPAIVDESGILHPVWSEEEKSD